MQKESKFKNRVLMDLGTLDGLYILKTQERSRRGVPDLIVCWRGQFVAIELKVDGQRPTKLQEFTLDNIIRSGGVAFFTTPSMWPSHFSAMKGLLS